MRWLIVGENILKNALGPPTTIQLKTNPKPSFCFLSERADLLAKLFSLVEC